MRDPSSFSTFVFYYDYCVASIFKVTFIIQNSCWSSSYHSHIPGSKEEEEAEGQKGWTFKLSQLPLRTASQTSPTTRTELI